MSTEQRREEFERFAMSLDMDLLIDSDGYSDCNTDYAWQAWQAALSRPAAPAPKDAAELLELINDYVGDRVGMETMPGHAELEPFERAADRAVAREDELKSAVTAMVQERDALRENGPIMDRGTDGNGKPWIGSMKQVMHDYQLSAETEAREVDRLNQRIAALEAQLAAQPVPHPEDLARWKLGFERYEKARKLKPVHWSELYRRNLAGEWFDDD